MENKKFMEIIEEGYSFPEEIDDPTQEAIISWFYDRRVCDNEKFERFFNRELLLRYPQYVQLLRIDPTVSGFDWLVTDYTERLLKRGAIAESGQYTMATISRMGTDTGTVKTESETSGGSESQGQGFNRAGGLAKASPMSASYSSTQMNAHNSDTIVVGDMTLGGFHNGFPDPMIDNPSQVSDNLTRTGDLNKTTTSGEDESTMTRNLANSSQDHTSGNTTTTSESDETTTEIATGRHAPIAPTLEKAYTYIERSNAFVWLRGQLEKCFMMVFDY